MTDPWMPFRQPRPGARRRLFCFPHAGGGAAMYLQWARLMPADTEVCAVQPPGRENRISERAYTRMEPLVDALGRALAPYLDLPFACFGHSMGSVIAYETARRLRAERGLEPLHLFVSARRAPHLRSGEAPSYALPDEEFKAKLRQYGGTPEAVLEHPELMELVLPLLKSDFELNDTYAPSGGEPLRCPITAFGGREDHMVREEHLDAWREATAAAFRLEMFAGNHFYVQRHGPALVNTVALELGSFLGEG
jgi:medium-chain acyl-[acyl-carrier-protein] hydrolase